MRQEAQSSKFGVKTTNYMSSGGGGHGVITANDLTIALSVISPDELTFTHKMVYEGHWPEHLLQSMIFKDLRERIKKQKTIKHSYLKKNHGSLFKAARDLSVGISDYLGRHKIKNQHLSQRFGIEKSKFSRYYCEFVGDCIADYESKLKKVTEKVHKITKDE